MLFICFYMTLKIYFSIVISIFPIKKMGLQVHGNCTQIHPTCSIYRIYTVYIPTFSINFSDIHGSVTIPVPWSQSQPPMCPPSERLQPPGQPKLRRDDNWQYLLWEKMRPQRLGTFLNKVKV